MADDAIKAEIIFGDNQMMELRSTVAEINSEIEGQKRLAVPVIKVVDAVGKEVWINATHIRTIKAYDE
jgi:hypothetical protein